MAAQWEDGAWTQVRGGHPGPQRAEARGIRARKGPMLAATFVTAPPFSAPSRARLPGRGQQQPHDRETSPPLLRSSSSSPLSWQEGMEGRRPSCFDFFLDECENGAMRPG